MAKQAVTAILFGIAFVALGLIRGPVAGLRNGLKNFRDSLSPWPARPLGPDFESGGRLPGQIWLAVIGAISILVGILVLIPS